MQYIEIPLTRGKFAKINLEDAPLVLRFKWRATPHDRTFYAVTTTPRRLGHRNIYMHRLLMESSSGDRSIDHINGDGLDNRRCNLRPASPCQQLANQRRLHRDNVSGFKGVSIEKRTGKWRARIMVEGRDISLGQFDSIEAAAAAYDIAARKLSGEFACTNDHMLS